MPGPAMIVTCEKCSTRFKIPDEKVTDKGVKVKCAKCAHTFRVNKQGIMHEEAAAPITQERTALVPALQAPVPPAAPPAAPAAGPEADPFAAFGDPLGAGPEEKTRAGVFALGIEASKEMSSGSMPKPKPLAVTSAPFDFSGLGSTARPSTPPVSSPSSMTPFDFGSLVPSAPRAAAPAPPASSPFDFSGLSPQPSVPAPVAAPPPTSSPFDFSALAPPPLTGAQPSLRAAAAAPAAPPFPTGAPAFPVPPRAAAAPAPAAPALTYDLSPAPEAMASAPARPTREEAVDLSMLAQAMPSAPQPTSRPAAPPPLSFGELEPSGSAPKPFTASLLANPPEPPSNPSAPNLASLQNQQKPADPLDFTAFGEEPVTKVAPRASAAEAKQMMAAPEPVSGGALGVEDEFPGRLPATSAPAAPPVVVPRGADAKVLDPEASVAAVSRRTALSAVVNFGLALLLVAGLLVIGSALVNDGKVDSRTFSWERIKSLFSAASPYLATDISNGLYETRGSRPVFYVRGVVQNRSDSATALKVRAEILDGDSLIRSAEAVVGAAPTPEELYRVSLPEDLSAMMEKLNARQPSVQPGTRQDFVVPFYEYPPDLKAFRVRVTITPIGSETAQR